MVQLVQFNTFATSTYDLYLVTDRISSHVVWEELDKDLKQIAKIGNNYKIFVIINITRNTNNNLLLPATTWNFLIKTCLAK